jgi:hypothetical protein
MEMLLNFCLILANSNANFSQFDTKSMAFVDEALDYIEEHFQGFIKVTKDLPAESMEEAQKIDLKVFPGIKSEEKTFNKEIIRFASHYPEGFFKSMNSTDSFLKKYISNQSE